MLPIDKAGMFAYTRRESVGVVAAIVRWNSPLLLLTWKLAPLLAVGNTVIIEPSEHASASTLAFAELFSEAGFPPGVVNTSISRNRRARSASLAAANLMRLVSYLGGASNRPSSRWFATAMDQQLSTRQLHRAVRRLQAERHRSPKRTLVNRRVSLDQVRLDRSIGKTAQSVHHPMKRRMTKAAHSTSRRHGSRA